MKSTLFRLVLAASCVLSSLAAQSTATYTFTNTAGTYSPITGGEVLESGPSPLPLTDTFYSARSIGFEFPWGAGPTGRWFTTLGISQNGWIKLGSDMPSSITLQGFIASTAATSVYGVAGCTANIASALATSEIRIETIGTAPNRICVIQWKDVGRVLSGVVSLNFNFQIRLHENGVVETAYGSFSVPTGTQTVGVGLKGSSTTDYRALTSTSTVASWTAPNQATSAGNTMFLSTTKLPDSGRTYRWTPAALPPAFVTVATSPAAFIPAGGSTVVTATIASVLPAATTFGTLSATCDVGTGTPVPMYDDATQGDLVAGDGIFSLTVTANPAVGTSYTLPCTITDGVVSGTASASLNVYTVANDIPSGAIPVVTGTNGPFDNNNTLTLTHPNYGNPLSPSPILGDCTTIGSRDVFFTYAPTCNGTFSASTCGGDNVNLPGELADSVITVFLNGVAIACNDDADDNVLCGPSGYQSRLQNISMTSGQTYLIRVASFGSAAVGTGTFNLVINYATAAKSLVGAPCNGLSLDGTLPVLGSTGTLTVAGGPASSLGLLAFSAGGSTGAPFNGCTLYLENSSINIVFVFNTDGVGGWSYTDLLPSDPALNCATIMLQAFTFGGTFAASNGLSYTFGT